MSKGDAMATATVSCIVGGLTLLVFYLLEGIVVLAFGYGLLYMLARGWYYGKTTES